MADHFEVTVVSIGYRLAPEDPWPAGAEDCYDAAEYLVKNGPEVFGGELMFTGGEVPSPPSYPPYLPTNNLSVRRRPPSLSSSPPPPLHNPLLRVQRPAAALWLLRHVLLPSACPAP
jgi:hypothetical protein